MTENADADELSHRDRGIRALAGEEYEAAGDAYATAARSVLAGNGPARSSVYDDRARSRAGDALGAYAVAAVCRRLRAGPDSVPDRARAHAAEGIVVAGELRDHVLETPVERAACHEFVGDLRAVIGDGERAGDAYDRAAEAYAACEIDSPAAETGRPFLQAGTELIAHLSRPDDIGWDDLHGSGDDALARRVRVKRSRTASAVDARVRAGTLHAPRGSTEYNTGRFRCPECDSDDVNYVAGTTLCLRCSTPTERA